LEELQLALALRKVQVRCNQPFQRLLQRMFGTILCALVVDGANSVNLGLVLAVFELHSPRGSQSTSHVTYYRAHTSYRCHEHAKHSLSK
jgi:hypothetical protein